MTDQIRTLLDELARARELYTLPARAHQRAAEFSDQTLAFLFPHFAPAAAGAPATELAALLAALTELLGAFGCGGAAAASCTAVFERALGPLREAMLRDAHAIWHADPAAKTLDEVILAYPGFMAMACHRLAHLLHGLQVPLLPRMIASHAQRQTGIDIHPGASIGPDCAIDHGIGIVIGETTVVGARVRIYQGVTLGAMSVEKSLADVKRHPTIEDDVTIYANATILGGDTVVGRGSIVGGNVWLTRSVPPRSVVTHRPADLRVGDEGTLEFHI
jgi:serine O-acetyltransferase